MVEESVRGLTLASDEIIQTPVSLPDNQPVKAQVHNLRAQRFGTILAIIKTTRSALNTA